MSTRIDQRLADLSLTLPEAPVPSANYVPVRRSGNQLFVAGQVSITNGESVTGKLGDDLTIDDGYAAARLCGLNILAQLKAYIGVNIDYAKAIKLGGFVNAHPAFTNPPQVINGASDLLIAVMGDSAGQHARFAVAVASLPGGAAVEIDAVFELEA